jgi:antitoxin component YwqK of YwqJK toxin-antitoxin module
MKRNIYILVLFVIALIQVGCGSVEIEKDLNVSEKPTICNCNDVFLDSDYGHFYTEKRDEPFTGECKNYFADGKVKSKKIYLDGKLEGLYLEYHENGQVKSEWNFLKGRQHGDYKGYDVSGELLYHSIFYKGDLDTTLYP